MRWTAVSRSARNHAILRAAWVFCEARPNGSMIARPESQLKAELTGRTVYGILRREVAVLKS